MDYDEAVKKTQVTLSVILLGMLMGVIALGGIGLYIGPVSDDSDMAPVMRWAAVALALGEFAGALYLNRSIGRRTLDEGELPERLQVVRTRVIVAAAMLEGAGLFAGVVILLTGPSWHVLPAYVLLPAGLGLIFPTRRNIVRAVGGQDGRPADKYT